MASDAPLALKMILDLAVLGALALAFFGRPPRRRRSDRLISAIGAAGLTGFTMGFLDVVGDIGSGESLLGPSVIAMCTARWLARARSDGEDDGGEEPDDGGDEPPPAIDWDDFDRARDDWSRPRVGSRQD